MHPKGAKILGGTMAAMSLLVTACAFGETPSSADSAGAARGWGSGMHGGFMRRHGGLQHLVGALDLSEQQQAEVRQIIEQSRAAHAAQRAELDALRAQVRESVLAGGFDEAQVRMLVESKSPIMVDMLVDGVRTLAEIRAVLTPEQQAKLDTLVEGRRGRGYFADF